MATETPRFLRVVGLIGLTAIALNGVVGAGIFVLPANVYKLVGEASPAAYILAAVLIALVVACFAEAGSRFDETGGPYLYARAAYGEFPGFLVGWMFFLARLAGTAAIINAFTTYLGYIDPSLGTGVGKLVAVTVAVAGLAVLNVFSVRTAASAVNVLTVGKMVPLLIFIGVGLFFVDPGRISFLALPEDDGSLRQAALLLVFAYGGSENANVPTEEARNPRRHLPFALLATIGATAVLYVLIQVVAQGTLPGLASSTTPLASAAREVMGPPGGWLLTGAAIVSTLGTASALILVGPRILYAFAHHGQLPAALAKIHPDYRSPYIAVVVFAVLAWGVAMSGKFAELAMLSAVARVLFSASTCLAVLLLRYRRRHRHLVAGFTLPGGPLIPLLAVGISVWLLIGLTDKQWIAGAIGLASGLVVYAGQRWVWGARGID